MGAASRAENAVRQESAVGAYPAILGVAECLRHAGWRGIVKQVEDDGWDTLELDSGHSANFKGGKERGDKRRGDE